MTVVLRPYQEDIIVRVRRALKVHRKALLVMPTGAGKTNTAGFMMKGSVSRNQRCFFMVHRKELVEQTCATMDKLGLDYGIVAAGMPFNPYKNITICSVGTLAARLDKVPAPDLIIVDEAHHSSAATWLAIFAAFPKAFYVGLTATPERLDGRGLDHQYKALVMGPTVRWLIDNGFLAEYRAWSHPSPELKGIRKIAGDYNQGQLAAAMDKPHLIGDIVDHYKKLAMGTQAVMFCVSVEHALHSAAAFKEAGIAADEIDGTANRIDRSNTIGAFRRGEIRVLTSVDLISEGFDLPEMQTTILARPTASLGLMTQQVGRCLRPAPGKAHAIILDHAGNIARHGLPDAEREWSLEGRKKKSGPSVAPVKQCPNCFGSAPAGVTACPYCGYAFPIQPREVTQVDGSLTEVDVAAVRAKAKAEQASATTYDELVALGRARGYAKPEGWARHLIKARGGRA